MIKEVKTVTPDDNIEDCIAGMKEKGCHHLLVMNKDLPIAVITMSYITNWLLQELNTDHDFLKQYLYGPYLIEDSDSLGT